VFFDLKTDESGKESLVVGGKWWLLLVIIIPLTILVFVVWYLLQRYRNRVQSDTLGFDQIPEFASTLEKRSSRISQVWAMGWINGVVLLMLNSCAQLSSRSGEVRTIVVSFLSFFFLCIRIRTIVFANPASECEETTRMDLLFPEFVTRIPDNLRGAPISTASNHGRVESHKGEHNIIPPTTEPLKTNPQENSLREKVFFEHVDYRSIRPSELARLILWSEVSYLRFPGTIFCTSKWTSACYSTRSWLASEATSVAVPSSHPIQPWNSYSAHLLDVWRVKKMAQKIYF